MAPSSFKDWAEFEVAVCNDLASLQETWLWLLMMRTLIMGKNDPRVGNPIHFGNPNSGKMPSK